MEIAYTEVTAFVCGRLFVCLHNPFSQEALCCIHSPHRKHEQDQLFLGPLLYMFSGKVVLVSSLLQFCCRSN